MSTQTDTGISIFNDKQLLYVLFIYYSYYVFIIYYCIGFSKWVSLIDWVLLVVRSKSDL